MLSIFLSIAAWAQTPECAPTAIRFLPAMHIRAIAELLSRLQKFNEESFRQVCNQSEFRSRMLDEIKKNDPSFSASGNNTSDKVVLMPDLLCNSTEDVLRSLHIADTKDQKHFRHYDINMDSAARFCRTTYNHGMLSWEKLCQMEKTLKESSPNVRDGNMRTFLLNLIGMREHLLAFRAMHTSLRVELVNDSFASVKETCSFLDDARKFSEKMRPFTTKETRNDFLFQHRETEASVEALLKNIGNNSDEKCQAAMEEMKKAIDANAVYIEDLNNIIKAFEPFVSKLAQDYSERTGDKFVEKKTDGSIQIVSTVFPGVSESIRGVLGKSLSSDWTQEPKAIDDMLKEFRPTSEFAGFKGSPLSTGLTRASVGIVGRLATEGDPPLIRPLSTFFLNSDQTRPAVWYTAGGLFSTVINEYFIGGATQLRLLLARPMVSGFMASYVTYQCTKDQRQAIAGGIGGTVGSILPRLISGTSKLIVQGISKFVGIPVFLYFSAKEGVLAVNEAELATKVKSLGHYTFGYMDHYYEQEGLGPRNMTLGNLLIRSEYLLMNWKAGLYCKED